MATETLYPQNNTGFLLDMLTKAGASPALLHVVAATGATHLESQYKSGQPVTFLLTTPGGTVTVDENALGDIEQSAVFGKYFDKWQSPGQVKFKDDLLLAKGAEISAGWHDEIQVFTATGEGYAKTVTVKADLTQTASPVEPTPAAEPTPPSPPTITIGLFCFDQHGRAVPYTGGTVIPTYGREMTAAIKAIAAAFGHTVVGRGRTKMSKQTKQEWLRAWHNGDLKQCYSIEQGHAKTSLKHPGAPGNQPTHRVIWQPAVAGETPAGELVPGDWSSPLSVKSGAEIDNYLIAAGMAHPRQLGSAHRARWVIAHQKGDKVSVDAISRSAKQSAGWHRSYPPVWNDLAPQPSLETCLQDEVAVNLWPVNALVSYSTDAGLPVAVCWSDLVTVVTEHRAQLAAEQAARDAVLTFTVAERQPTLTGYHRKMVLVDQHGRQWLFKPAPLRARQSQPELFRAQTEHEAHTLARAWGYRTAESQLIEFDGVYGQIQAMLPIQSTLAGFTGAAFATLTRTQLCALAREHLLDWAIDNDDSHGENIGVLADGSIVGIDKGRAWRYFGGWDGLSGDSSANSNAPLAYTALYAAIAQHHLDRDTVDAMYREVIAQARRMQRLPDARLAEIIGRAVANRPHYRPSSYQPAVSDAPADAAELIAAATARKNTLVTDMTALWSRIYQRAGWPPPDPLCAPLGDNAQGHPLHSGLQSPELHHAITQTKSYGTAAFVAGTDIEDAHILLWRERRPDGAFTIRGHAKVRGEAYQRLRTWCREHTTTAKAAPKTAAPTLPGEPAFYEAIIAAAKTISYHHEDKQYNDEKIAKLQWATTQLLHDRKRCQTLLDQYTPDPDGALAATAAMCQQYLGYIDAITVHQHQGSRSKEGDFPRYLYTPTTVEPLPPPPPAPFTVELCPATRAAAHQGETVKLGHDGELDLDGSVLRDGPDYQGQPGKMYLITLPGGQQIEYRGASETDTPRALHGQLQFSIPNAEHLPAALATITNQLAVMGLTLADADLTDLELFYWRHLAAVMGNRADSRPDGQPSIGVPQGKYSEFWRRTADVGKTPSRDQELAMWRHAFAALCDPEQIEAFLAADGHLPRFMHLDTRNPTQPCGKPYWERFDVPRSVWATRAMPVLAYRSGPRWAVAAGACMSTETRIRTMAIWKNGMSSVEDMTFGSSAYVFTRQNMVEFSSMNVYVNPRVLIRTTNYAYPVDQFGRVGERKLRAYFDFATATGYIEHGNELMIKHSLSLLDDIEVLVFADEAHRARAIKMLAERGITEIRGLPVATRIVNRRDPAARAAALAAVKQSLMCPS